MVTILAVTGIGYILGSIPTGVWLGKTLKSIDLREHGSKSMGATNVFRVLGWKLAVITLLIDIGKGYLAAFLASKTNFGDIALSSIQLALIAGLAAIVGHLFPLFARFKGGKGIATGAGLLLFLSPLELGFTLLVFLATVFVSRYVSLGSILAASFYSISIFLERYYLQIPISDEMIALAFIIAVLVFYTHRSNIGRLLSSSENKIGARK